MKEYIEPIENLADMFRRLPGIGRKTAVRLAFSVVDFPDEIAEGFASAIIAAKRDVRECRVCFNMADGELCSVCSDFDRDRSTICVVEDSRAVIAIEKSRGYHGLYHVLHGAISPVKRIGPDDLRIAELIERAKSDEVEEIILATNPTVEGETTALFLSKQLSSLGVKVSRLANGIPVGGDLEYTDGVTLQRALDGRYEV
jgi:recombination protein RecR